MKTILFGAGASIPFFTPQLDTKYLTNQVCSESSWDNIISKYNVARNTNICSAKDVMEVINIISKIYKKNLTFEQIAEIIDKVCSYGENSYPNNNLFNSVLSVMNYTLSKNFSNHYQFHYKWADIPFLLREIIAEAILDLENHSHSHNYVNLISKQSKFIEYISEDTENVSIVSLNYDDCVYNSVINKKLGFKTCFENTLFNDLTLLNVKNFLCCKKVLYFPHGHLRFQYTNSGDITLWEDINTANSVRMCFDHTKYSTVTKIPGKFAYNYNTFLSTGQSKEEGFNQIPYSTYYQRLAIDLYMSSKIYIIGYSFGDDHINRLLQSFLMLKRTNQLYVIDLYNGLIKDFKELNMNEDLNTNNCISKLIHLFSKSPLYQNPNKVKEINLNGFGEILDQIVYYKKGYESFLNEYPNVV